MCTPCALRQKIGFIKKTEELVRFFGLVVSGHWVMWRDGEGLGLEDGGELVRDRVERTTPPHKSTSLTLTCLSLDTLFSPLRSFTARTDCACDWEGQSLMTVLGQLWVREVMVVRYSACVHINQYDCLFVFIRCVNCVHWFTWKHM